ncbi:MAG: multiubiquitin domain-containing protein [Terracidiphilus sp.]
MTYAKIGNIIELVARHAQFATSLTEVDRMSDELREREHEVEREIRRDEERLKQDEERLEGDIKELEAIEHEPHPYKLIVNKGEKDWPERYIKGRQILELAGSPADWVVNELVPGAGEDPEIGPDQPVDLDFEAEPKGIKKFQTRKPKTNPGAEE